MSILRGVLAFETLWERRVTLLDPSDTQIHLLALPDLVKAKKTQRDKDWPMVRRLIEADIMQHQATAADRAYWAPLKAELEQLRHRSR